MRAGTARRRAGRGDRGGAMPAGSVRNGIVDEALAVMVGPVRNPNGSGHCWAPPPRALLRGAAEMARDVEEHLPGSLCQTDAGTTGSICARGSCVSHRGRGERDRRRPPVHHRRRELFSHRRCAPTGPAGIGDLAIEICACRAARGPFARATVAPIEIHIGHTRNINHNRDAECRRRSTKEAPDDHDAEVQGVLRHGSPSDYEDDYLDDGTGQVRRVRCRGGYDDYYGQGFPTLATRTAMTAMTTTRTGPSPTAAPLLAASASVRRAATTRTSATTPPWATVDTSTPVHRGPAPVAAPGSSRCSARPGPPCAPSARRPIGQPRRRHHRRRSADHHPAPFELATRRARSASDSVTATR